VATTADNSSFGGNGLPVITTPITIAGADATIARSSAQPFRIFEVDGPGDSLSVSALTITGGDVGGRRRHIQQRRHAEAEREHRDRQRLRGRGDERGRRGQLGVRAGGWPRWQRMRGTARLPASPAA
jgi:hypothetical protein